jgi:Pyridoxamine 5'-phosphate oxidase
MGSLLDRIDERLAEFLQAQPVFFVATAPLAGDGHVNVSPKGGAGSLVVLDERTVAYLDLTGSGAETHAHLRENGRITLMWCAFEGPPRIVRVWGSAEAVLPDDERWTALARRFPAGGSPGARAVIVVRAERIGSSCGFSVPLMDYLGERELLTNWAQRKGTEGIAAYHRAKNAVSIDGLPALPLPGHR